MAYAVIEDSDQPAHVRRLIRAFADRMRRLWIEGYTGQRMNALHLAHMQEDTFYNSATHS